MKISPTNNSITIAAWLIATISRTSSPCLFAAAFEGFVVDEELNPLTEAVRSVNRDAYKLVKLETLNYDRDVSKNVHLSPPYLLYILSNKQISFIVIPDFLDSTQGSNGT
jgi:hypothetical protein